MNWPLIFIIGSLVVGLVGGLIAWERWGGGPKDGEL
jgi:hypothetical protein